MRWQLVVVALLAGGCGRSQTVVLVGQGPQGLNGSALLTEGDNVVTVDLTLPGDVGTHPAEVRNGRCGVDGSNFASLSDVVNGHSTTVVPHRYADFQGSTHVQVEASADAGVVSCGNVQ